MKHGMKNKNLVGAIIQARYDSNRLRGKVFEQIDGKTVLEHIVNKIKTSNKIDYVIVATSDEDIDKQIIEFCKKKKILSFAADKNDVLARYYKCAFYFKLDTIIRITADNPLIDMNILNTALIKFNEGYNYVANNIEKTFPHGLDLEIIDFQSLKKSFFDAKSSSFREHVTQYVRHNKDLFKTYNLLAKNNYHHIRVTLDTEEDLKVIKEVVSKSSINVTFDELIEVFRNNKHLLKINNISKIDHKLYNSKNNIV